MWFIVETNGILGSCPTAALFEDPVAPSEAGY